MPKMAGIEDTFWSSFPSHLIRIRKIIRRRLTFVTVSASPGISLNSRNTVSGVSAEKLKSETPMLSGDFGFRVFKLASSNIRAWEPDAADLENSLLKNAEHLVHGRKEQDVLYELC